MNLTTEQARTFFQEFLPAIAEQNLERLVVGIAPSFTELELAVRLIDAHNVLIGAQDVSDEEAGPYTGEISARQLKVVGASFVLIGHSERRQRYLETNERLRAKLQQALHQQLTPLFCVGEQASERHRIVDVLSYQLEPLVQVVADARDAPVYIAYEPVWAIGTGITPTLDEISAAHGLIQEFMMNRVGRTFPVLYGGSVNRNNVASIANLPMVEGVLVGGASTDPLHFYDIVKCCSSSDNL